MWLTTVLLVGSLLRTIPHGSCQVFDEAEFRGPVLLSEPPSRLDFSNNTGAILRCTADGQPSPTIEWIYANDGSTVADVSGLRKVYRENGSLVINSFHAERFRQDIHATVYKCLAYNTVGVVSSRNIHVRTVVQQLYEIHVYDEFVIAGNTAVFKCNIPSFVQDYVSVTSWIRDPGFHLDASMEYDDKYKIMPGGELHIRHVSASDSSTSYRCRTVHKMTGEVRISTSSGRLIVTEPPGSVPPRIYHLKLNIRARKDDSVVLPCVAQGFPVPLYSWFKKSEDSALSPVPVLSGRYRQEVDYLKIESVQETDTAIYVCLMNNTVGNERAETSLFVWKPLSVSIQPKLQVAILGQSVRFHCVISGFPVLSITWMKDAKTINGKSSNNLRNAVDDDFTVSQDLLVVNSVRKEHRGMYQCLVFNDDDSIQASAELRLSDLLPEFRYTFTEVSVQPGSNVSLRCSAFGIPLPAISWRLDDNQVTTKGGSVSVKDEIDEHGDVVSYLNSSHVTIVEGGEYTCVAANRAGHVTHSARVNVYGSPFIRPIGRKSAVAGRHMTIKCPFGGHPVEAIYWEKDGIRLPIDHRQVAFRNGTLVIRDVQRSQDGGRYRCVVVGAEGRSVSRDVEVTVLVPPTVVPFVFQESQLHLGMRAQVFCAVSEGDLPLTLMWLKDGQPLTQSVDVVVRRIDDYTSSLVISAIGPRHRGNYSCVAANSAASASHSAFLSVHVPPSWVLMPSDVEVYLGSVTMVDCKVDGTPEPKIKWMKAVENSPGDYDEVAYVDEHTRQLPNGSLFMNRIREQDGGIYSCRATNGVGPGLGKVISVVVRIPVKFDVKYSNITARTGDTANLRCQPSGDSPMEVAWFFGGRKLNIESNPRFSVEEMNGVSGRPLFDLMISDVNRRDAGIYVCQVRNAYGGDETRVRLIVLEPPQVPEGVTVVNHGSRSISLSWAKSYHNNNVINRYIIQLTDTVAGRVVNVTVAGSEISTAVSGLSPATSYMLRMAAENQVGLSEFSKQVSIITAEEAPSDSPQDVTAESIDSNSISVSWKAPNRDSWNGVLRGFHVGHRIADSADNYIFQTVDLTEDPGSERFSTLVANLKQFTKYSVTVRAFNGVGYGPKSDEIYVITLEGVPDRAPTNLSCMALSAQSLKIWWDPLPNSAVNGVLQGYKVLYTPSPSEEWYGDNFKMESIHVDSGHVHIITGLKKSTNYSVQIVGFTQAGDGEKSTSIICSTKEDVPDAPADIKVMAMSGTSILVTWKPPIESNGVLVKYNIYMRRTEQQLNREDVSKHAIPASQTFFEADGLQLSGRYEFWVTGSTAIGEGQSTRVVHMRTTGTEVPSRIVSFGRKFFVSWNKFVELPCQAVGLPQPTLTWTFESRPLASLGDRTIFVANNGSLLFHKVNAQHQGNYVCRSSNKLGTDEISYYLKVEVAPQSPTLTIVSVSLFALELKWLVGEDGGSPIRKFDLYYKRDFSEWEQLTLPSTQFNITLENLECGTGYQIYITATNRHGTSAPSSLINGKTKGTSPTAPDKSSFILVGATSVTLFMSTWHSGGCPILYFVVQYKLKSNADYRLVSNNVLLQPEFIIPDLSPATHHTLQVTAHNNAGSTVARYDITTSPLAGGTVVPARTLKEEQESNYLFYSDVKMIVLATSLIVLVFTVIVIVWFCCNRKRRINLDESGSSPLPATHLGRQDMGHGNTFLLGTQRKDLSKFSEAMIRKDSACDEVNPYATSQIVNNHQLNEMHVFVGERNSRISAVYPALNSEGRSLPRKRDENGVKGQDRNYCQQEYTIPVEEMSPEIQQRVLTTCYPVYASFPRITNRSDPRQVPPDLLEHGAESSCESSISEESSSSGGGLRTPESVERRKRRRRCVSDPSCRQSCRDSKETTLMLFYQQHDPHNTADLVAGHHVFINANCDLPQCSTPVACLSENEFQETKILYRRAENQHHIHNQIKATNYDNNQLTDFTIAV